MALYISHSIFHLARLLHVRPETFGPYYVYLGSSLLDPGNIKIWSRVAIWNFSKGRGFPWADIILLDTKGPFLSPRYIGTVRALTQLLTNQSINTLFFYIFVKLCKFQLWFSLCDALQLPFIILFIYSYTSRSQWPRGLRRVSAAAHLLRLWVRIPPGA